MNSGEAVSKFIFVVLLFILILTGCLHNKAPVSDAGEAQHVMPGEYVQLDGSGSYDSDGLIVGYRWELTHRPMGSSASLNFRDRMSPILFTDYPGVYVAELVVFDGELYSGRDVVVITIDNDVSAPVPAPFPMPPIPHPGEPPVVQAPVNNYVAMINQLVEIDAFLPGIGRGSIQQSIWQIVEKPTGATVEIATPTSSETLFSADLAGDYFLSFQQRRDNIVSGNLVHVRVQESEVDLGGAQVVMPGQIIHVNLSLVSDLRDLLLDPQVDDVSVRWVITTPKDGILDTLNTDDYGAMLIAHEGNEYSVTAKVTTPEGELSDSITVFVAELNGGNGFDHSDISTGCARCHNGVESIGKSAIHIASSNACENCHSINTWFPVISVDHNEVIGSCMSCHNGVTAVGKNRNHLATTDQCDACHSTSVLAPVITVDHTQVLGECSACHNNITAVGMSAMHIPLTSTDMCDKCHSTVSWLPVLEEGSNSLFPAGLELSLEGVDETYQPGELIKLSASLINNGENSVEYYRLSSTKVGVEISIRTPSGLMFTLTNPNDSPFDAPFVNKAKLLTGESVVRNVIWDQFFPSGEAAVPGVYEIIASSIVTHRDGVSRGEFMQIGEIKIDSPLGYISEEKAIIVGLEDPDVKVWYEMNSKSILCSTQQRGLILVNNYIATPIATFAPVPDSEINCRLELLADENMWLVSYRTTRATQTVVYQVGVDAVEGVIVQSSRELAL